MYTRMYIRQHIRWFSAQFRVIRRSVSKHVLQSLVESRSLLRLYCGSTTLDSIHSYSVLISTCKRVIPLFHQFQQVKSTVHADRPYK